MFEIFTTLITNLFRTFIIKKFIVIFFPNDVEDKKKERNTYCLFFLVTIIVHLVFNYPPANIITNILMIYYITQLYDEEQKKKVLVSFLIYGINMICDVLSMYAFMNYIVGEEYSQIGAYVTVLLISICEFIIEKYLIKNKDATFTPPYWNILVVIPIISIILLFVLMMNNINNRMIVVTISAGILFINMLVFYLYNALIDTYLKLEENILFERQIASYSNQLDVLMQSEEKVSALQHDIRHHLNEFLVMADKGCNQEIIDYIYDMQMFMDNQGEYARSGNKEIDSILNYMIKKAEQILKKVEYKINIPKELGIKSFDLNVIFGNLLDNAILAASNSQEKWLYIFITYDKGMLFINIKNSFNINIIKYGKEYVTTKKDMHGHGIGLQNVKKVVNGYHGKIDITDDNDIFDVKIMLYTLLMK